MFLNKLRNFLLTQNLFQENFTWTISNANYDSFNPSKHIAEVFVFPMGINFIYPIETIEKKIEIQMLRKQKMKRNQFPTHLLWFQYQNGSKRAYQIWNKVKDFFFFKLKGFKETGRRKMKIKSFVTLLNSFRDENFLKFSRSTEFHVSDWFFLMTWQIEKWNW